MALAIESTKESRTGNRRDFLYVATGAAAAVGTLAALFPMIGQMEPDASTLAAGGPVDFDLSKLQPGQQAVVRWRSRPVFIVNRPPAAVKTLQDPKLGAIVRRRLKRTPATALCRQLASLGKAGIQRARRHLHPSRLHSDVLSRPKR
jgi:ubiquinol-cytochrome c reductase iron-sulfur subunit